MKLPISGKYKNIEVLVDDDDWKKVKDFSWWIANKKNGYMTVYTQVKGKTIYLSRLLLNFPKQLQVDHINGNPLDNRKNNLRPATPRQNSLNSKIKKTNVSGFPGVDFRKDRNKWRATIRINGIKKSLGHFDTFQEAIAARMAATKEYYKEFDPNRRKENEM